MTGEPDDAAPSEGRQAGFVLVSVLGLILLFVTVSATYAVKARLLALQTGNRIEAAQLGALADGAVLFAADALRRPAASLPDAGAGAGAGDAAAPTPAVAGKQAGVLALDGTPYDCRLDGGRRVVVSVVDQGGLLDLNAAPPAAIEDILKTAGIGWRQASTIAAEIADFRDADDDPAGTGVGEAAQYAGLGLSWGPRNAPFADADEIAQLPSAALLARLRPLFTTENENAGLDFATLSKAARALLPDEPQTLPDLARWQADSPRRFFEVTARLYRSDGSLGAARRARVDLGEAAGAMPAIRRWSLPPPEEGDGDEDGGGNAAGLDASGSPFCAVLMQALRPAEADPPG